jgi:hypothetical protein
VNEIYTETRINHETGEKSWATFPRAVLGFQKEIIYWSFYTNSPQATIQIIGESLQKKGILAKDLFIAKYQTRTTREQMGKIHHAPKLWKGFPVMVAGICLPSTDDMPDLEKALKRLLKKQGISRYVEKSHPHISHFHDNSCLKILMEVIGSELIPCRICKLPHKGRCEKTLCNKMYHVFDSHEAHEKAHGKGACKKMTGTDTQRRAHKASYMEFIARAIAYKLIEEKKQNRSTAHMKRVLKIEDRTNRRGQLLLMGPQLRKEGPRSQSRNQTGYSPPVK